MSTSFSIVSSPFRRPPAATCLQPLRRFVTDCMLLLTDTEQQLLSPICRPRNAPRCPKIERRARKFYAAHLYTSLCAEGLCRQYTELKKKLHTIQLHVTIKLS